MTDRFRPTADLWATVLWATIAVAVVVGAGVESQILRALLLLPMVLLLPGYALISTLYPDARTSDGSAGSGAGWWRSPALRPVGRTALAVGTSVGIVALLALVVNATPYPLRVTPLLPLLGGITVALSFVAMFVRLALPPERRFEPPGVSTMSAGIRRYFTSGTDSLRVSTPREATSWRGVFSNVLLFAGVLSLVASAAYATTLPTSDQTFTEFHLLSPNENGTLTAENLPREYNRGVPREVHVMIGNREGTTLEYTTVATFDGREVDRFDTVVGRGETVRVRRQIELDRTGESRLVFLLYRGSVPANPRPGNAYRMVRLSVTVDDTPTTGEE